MKCLAYNSSGRYRPTAVAHGVTIIEMLLVLAIIGLMTGLLLGGARKMKDTARDRRTRSILTTLSGIATEYEAQTSSTVSSNPNSEKSIVDFVAAVRQIPIANQMLSNLGKDVVVRNGSGTITSIVDGSGTITSIVDVWGNPLRYAQFNNNGEIAELPNYNRPFFASAGPDGQFGKFGQSATPEEERQTEDNLYSYELD